MAEKKEWYSIEFPKRMGKTEVREVLLQNLPDYLSIDDLISGLILVLAESLYQIKGDKRKEDDLDIIVINAALKLKSEILKFKDNKYIESEETE